MRVQGFEEGHALGQERVIITAGQAETFDHHADRRSLGRAEAAILQIEIGYHGRDSRECRLVRLWGLAERLEDQKRRCHAVEPAGAIEAGSRTRQTPCEDSGWR
jgi:hypothetical protein